GAPILSRKTLFAGLESPQIDSSRGLFVGHWPCTTYAAHGAGGASAANLARSLTGSLHGMRFSLGRAGI
ncbi:MAG: hypothetical protein ACI8QZ_003871, partial [Chlamydiales bacterium]